MTGVLDSQKHSDIDLAAIRERAAACRIDPDYVVPADAIDTGTIRAYDRRDLLAALDGLDVERLARALRIEGQSGRWSDDGSHEMKSMSETLAALLAGTYAALADAGSAGDD